MVQAEQPRVHGLLLLLELQLKWELHGVVAISLPRTPATTGSQLRLGNRGERRRRTLGVVEFTIPTHKNNMNYSQGGREK